ncbi:hypothetical protein NUW58_g9760 [Xylaria curta]|uniref:Uncharacterized protein n=1 Tax=Xylaria curta TaxID=42375 RepID=A0ACC1MVD3_9PEZI|nr:hypothetical protein NUW58_g9760 [Xylaria curta]
MPSHKHLHMRQAHKHWNGFIQGVESVANELNPFKDTPHTLQGRAPETVYKTVYTTIDNSEAEVRRRRGDRRRLRERDRGSKPDTHKAPAKQSESLPESLAPSKSVNLAGESTLALASTTSLKQETQFPTTTDASSSLGPADAASSSSPTPSSSPSSSDSSPGVKAGIAIGVLGGLLAVGLLIFFLFSKRRKQLEQQRALDDEKVNGPFAGGRTASIRSTRTSATAPRLSLRPLTQFNPTFNERRSSKGAGLMLATAGAGPQSATREKGGSMWERPSTAHSNNPENPFNDNARAYSPTGNGPSAPLEPASNPFESPEHVVGMAQTTDLPATPTTPVTAGAGVVAVAAAAAAAVGTSTSLNRKASTRKEAT